MKNNKKVTYKKVTNEGVNYTEPVPQTDRAKEFEGMINSIDENLTDDSKQIKKKIFSLGKMESLVHADPKLSKIYQEMAEDGKEKYGYHYNETIMNIIFNDYVLTDPKYLQKYKMTKPKKKKRRDAYGIEQLKKDISPEEKTPKKKKDDDVDETTTMTSFSRYGKGGTNTIGGFAGDGDLLNENENRGELHKDIYDKYTKGVRIDKTDKGNNIHITYTSGDVLNENENGYGLKNFTIDYLVDNARINMEQGLSYEEWCNYMKNKYKIEDDEVFEMIRPYVEVKDLDALKHLNEKSVEETTTAGSAGGASGYVGYETPHAWASNKKPIQKKAFWQGGDVIGESNYLTNPKCFKKYINLIMENEKTEKDKELDDYSERLKNIMNYYSKITNEGEKPPSEEEGKKFKKMYSSFLVEFISKYQPQLIRGVDDEEIDESKQPINEDDKSNKIEFIINATKRLTNVQDHNFDEESVKQTLDLMDISIVRDLYRETEKQLNQAGIDPNLVSMNEHHKQTREEKIGFIKKNMSDVKNIEKTLERMEDNEIDRIYNKLEKKMGLINETNQSIVDQPKDDSMSFKPDPRTSTGSNMDMGIQTGTLKEDHKDKKSEKINYVIGIFDKIGDTINIDKIKSKLKDFEEDVVDYLYNYTEKSLEKLGISPKHQEINEKAQSKAQQRFMGMVRGLQKGEIDPEDVDDDIVATAEKMTPKDTKKYAQTKHDDLPEKIKNENNMKNENKEKETTTDVDKIVNEMNDIVNESNKVLKNMGYKVDEQQKTPSMVNKERHGKDNQKNFKRDIQHSGTKDIIDHQKEMEKSSWKDQQEVLQPDPMEDPRLGRDLEEKEMEKHKGKAFKNKGDSTNKKGDEIPKRNLTTSEEENVDVKRRGVGDYVFDNEPGERFEERMKDQMGEEHYEKRQKRIKYRENRPMYNKDTQPVTDGIDKNQYEKHRDGWNKKGEMSESVVTGLYLDDLNKRKLVNFQINESIFTDKLPENIKKLSFDGQGNSYVGYCELNESVINDLNGFNYFIEPQTNKVYRTKKQLNEQKEQPKIGFVNEEKLNKFKHLYGYNPKDFTDTKNVKKNRGF